MDGDQFFQTVQQWEELRQELEVELANEILAQMRAEDEEFRKQLEEKYPMLRSWR